MILHAWAARRILQLGMADPRRSVDYKVESGRQASDLPEVADSCRHLNFFEGVIVIPHPDD